MKNKRVWGWIFAVLCLIFLAWTIYTPIPFGFLKVGALMSVLALLALIGIGFKRGKWAVLAVLTPLFLLAMWPASAPNSANLSANYQRSLRAYLGTRYVWGGENARGIDCSGLMRRAVQDALISQGWQEKKPSLWRAAAQIWWRDCSAREMKNGYGGQIRAVFAAKNLNACDYARLQNGDLAVTASGVHILAYVGNQTWIQADPNLAEGGDKVIMTRAPSTNGWFRQKMVICRWVVLE